LSEQPAPLIKTTTGYRDRPDSRGRDLDNGFRFEAIAYMRICIVNPSFRPDGNFVYPYVYAVSGATERRPEVVRFNGIAIGARWPAEGLIVATEPSNHDLGDFPEFASAGCLVMSARAYAVLSNILEPCGEILPLVTTDGTELFLLNPLPYFDSIDMVRSWGPRGRDGRLIDITKHEFVRERIPTVAVFKSKYSWSTIFSIEDRYGWEESLQSLVELHGLKGLTFHEVWNDVQGGIPREYR